MKTFTPIQYLEIDVATNYGLDKNSWEDRLKWFDANRLQIEEGSIDGLKQGLLRHAKEPALVLAGIFAYRDMLEDKPIGYTVGMDATASGLQILSLLINCRKSAMLCNLIDVGGCVDAYTVVYEGCRARGLRKEIARKDAKRALMTHLYGSKAVPREVFGEGEDLATFYGVLDELLPGANAVNHALLKLWNPEALVHAWTLPDGFDVNIKVMGQQETGFRFFGEAMTAVRKVNMAQPDGLSLGANIVHSIDGMVVREMVRRCGLPQEVYDRAATAVNSAPVMPPLTHRKQDLDLLRLLELYNESGFMSARILEVIDEYNIGLLGQSHKHALSMLWDSLPTEQFDLLTIHDCFRCHPNHVNAMRQQYNNILSEIAGSEMLRHIAYQLTGQRREINKIDPTMVEEVRNAEYALC